MDRELLDESTNPVDALVAMVERLQAEGVLESPAVVEALSTVRRHDFINGASVETAYAETAVNVKMTDNGIAISSVSQPRIVGAMLELLCVEPGHSVLEVGAGSGYNAALLSSMVGPRGLVVTVELEADLALAAEERLRRYGFTNVEVVNGDGAAGHPRAAPYDRVIVTTGARSIARAWADQLREGGRLVTPVVNSNGIGLIHCLQKRDSQLEEVVTMPCGFLPMRSV